MSDEVDSQLRDLAAHVRVLEQKNSRLNFQKNIAFAFLIILFGFIFSIGTQQLVNQSKLAEKLDFVQAATGLFGALSRPAQQDARKFSQRLTQMLFTNNYSNLSTTLKVLPFESIEGRGGIIEWLRSEEEPFHRKVRIIQSSNEITHIVHPYSPVSYESGSSGKAWIQFVLRNSTRVNGVKLISTSLYSPRSFEICYGPDDEVLETMHNVRLSHQPTVIQFREVNTTLLKVRQTGPNWRGTQNMGIAKVDFLSPDERFSQGVFETIFNEARTYNDMFDWVEVHARDFDLEEVHLPDGRASACTDDNKLEWVQMEVVGGKLLATNYRLKRSRDLRLRNWTIRGSNELTIPMEEWEVLDRKYEEKQGQFKIFDAWEISGGPYRYFRIVHEGPKWDGSDLMIFKSIEFYGIYIAD